MISTPGPADELRATWRVAPGTATLPEGAASGPLAGVTVAVKDLFAVAGQPVGGGHPGVLAAASVEPRNAAAVQTLLDAGARLAGIAQTDELAFSIAGSNAHYGAPPNAAAPGHLTGGSSSGSAAAVASGQAGLGLGTDTAGSIRVPASYCGLYGLRPTHGAISLDATLPLAPSFDTAGLLAADPAVLTAAADVLLPPGRPERPERLVLSASLLGVAEERTAAASEAAARSLAEQLSLPVERVADDFAPDELARWLTAFADVQAAEAWRSHGATVERLAGTFEPAVEARFRHGAEVDAASEAAARSLLAEAAGRLHALLPEGTVLALPAAAGPAPRADADAASKERTRNATRRLVMLASAAGTPVLVVPAAAAGNLPVGLALTGRAGADRTLLTLIEGSP